MNSDVGGSGTWDNYVMDSAAGLPGDRVGNSNNQFNYIKGTSCSNNICSADDTGPLPNDFPINGNGSGLFCGTTYPVCNL
jgi:hypothetical protein